MAKPETRDYFRTTIDQVPTDQLGALSTLLAYAGFESVRHELVTDVLRYKQKKPSHDVKAEDFLIDWIADHKAFQAREAIQHFRNAGRTDGAGYSSLRELVKRKLLRKLGEGRYTTVALREAPKKLKPAKAAKAAPKQHVRHEVDHRTFLLRTASRNHGRFNTAWMKKQFDKDGRTPGNVSPTISALVAKKLLKRVGDSEYVLLQKAPAPKKTAKAKPIGNGAAAPAVESAVVVTHG